MNTGKEPGGKGVAYKVALAAAVVVLAVLLFRPMAGEDLRIEVVRQGEGRIGLDDVVEFTLKFSDENGKQMGPVQKSTVAMARLTRPIQEAAIEAGIGGIAKFVSTYDIYVPAGKPSEFPQGKPVRGEIEVLGIIPGEFAVPAYPRKYSVGILTMDLTGGGMETLGGQGWQRGEKTTDWIDARQCRAFTMDGSNHRLWEWSAGKMGMLVLNLGEEEVPLEVSGSNLLCTYTGLQVWKSVYDVLAVLDADGDGEIKGEEMKGLLVWIDDNGDGRIVTAELKEAGSILQSISTRYEEDAKLGRSNPDAGLMLVDGTKGGTWEFWSRGRADVVSNKP